MHIYASDLQRFDLLKLRKQVINLYLETLLDEHDVGINITIIKAERH